MGDREPVPIHKILRQVLLRRGIGSSLQLERVREAVEGALDDRHRGRIRVAALKAGVLTLEVDSSALLYELRGFHQQNLLAKLKIDPSLAFLTSLRFQRRTSSNG